MTSWTASDLCRDPEQTSPNQLTEGGRSASEAHTRAEHTVKRWEGGEGAEAKRNTNFVTLPSKMADTRSSLVVKREKRDVSFRDDATAALIDEKIILTRAQRVKTQPVSASQSLSQIRRSEAELLVTE